MTTSRELASTVRNIAAQAPSADDLLGAVGLQFRRSATEATFATLGAFVLGAAVGATVALLAAPRSGRETRQALGRQAGEAAERVRERLAPMDEGTGMR